MDEAAELADYLPLSFMSRRDGIPWDKTPKEQEYIEFLWDAFETNHTHGKYQFAFLAYHMLTMSFVYFNIWQIKQTTPKDFAMGLIGFGKDIEKSLLDATSPSVFSTVNERSILRFLKLIACDNGSKIGIYAKLVDDRNEFAHPNGNIFYSIEAALDIKITARDDNFSQALPCSTQNHGKFYSHHATEGGGVGLFQENSVLICANHDERDKCLSQVIFL